MSPIDQILDRGHLDLYPQKISYKMVNWNHVFFNLKVFAKTSGTPVIY